MLAYFKEAKIGTDRQCVWGEVYVRTLEISDRGLVFKEKLLALCKIIGE